jgi:hypothetical protein
VRELEDRLKLALEELRELKSRNAELTEAARTPRAAVIPDDTPAGGFDWEAQKLRLLAQLEDDSDDQDPEQQADRLRVEEVVRITDQVVAEKDREIAELKQLLENQASNLGNLAVGAAGVAEALEIDELIREERENLKQLQEEWREKLRQSEVDISVERAKIARQRMELEEKIRTIERERDQLAGQNEDPSPADNARSRPRGNWLSRLGLSEDEG